jgi:Dynamin family
LSDSKVFSGKVWLQRYKEREGENLSFSILESKDEIGAAIERLTQMLVEEGQVISDDSIVIEASGPGFPNLTLTDLHGLIRTTKKPYFMFYEDKSMVPRVRALFDRYLAQDRTIILAVVPANVDMHNTEVTLV